MAVSSLAQMRDRTKTESRPPGPGADDADALAVLCWAHANGLAGGMR